jgi:uncharacterized damage-inducible protein DinB
MTIASAFADEFTRETRNTRRMLERVPWEQAEWRPHPKSATLGGLAIHIARLAGFPEMILATAGRDLAAGQPPAPTPTSTAELLAAFDASVEASVRALQSASADALMQTWTLRRGEQVIVSVPRAAAIRNLAFNHACHHRGQLSVYLRLKDIPVPGMYGPSADER